MDLRRLEGKELEDALAALTRAIVASLDPERILLFGSFARGDQNRASDFDLVVVARTSLPFLDRIGRVLEACHPVSPLRPVEALVYTPEEWQRMLAEGRSFAHHVEREARVLHERGSKRNASAAKTRAQRAAGERSHDSGLEAGPSSTAGVRCLQGLVSDARRWLRQALHDRDAARLNREHSFFEHACFVAQQSAEKALKAFLYARGQGPVLGHSTLALSEAAAVLEPAFGSLGDACRRLDQLYIGTRYPNGIPDGVPHDFYDRGLADQALADLDAVLACGQRFVVI